MRNKIFILINIILICFLLSACSKQPETEEQWDNLLNKWDESNKKVKDNALNYGINENEDVMTPKSNLSPKEYENILQAGGGVNRPIRSGKELMSVAENPLQTIEKMELEAIASAKDVKVINIDKLSDEYYMLPGEQYYYYTKNGKKYKVVYKTGRNSRTGEAVRIYQYETDETGTVKYNDFSDKNIIMPYIWFDNAAIDSISSDGIIVKRYFNKEQTGDYWEYRYNPQGYLYRNTLNGDVSQNLLMQPNSTFTETIGDDKYIALGNNYGTQIYIPIKDNETIQHAQERYLKDPTTAEWYYAEDLRKQYALVRNEEEQKKRVEKNTEDEASAIAYLSSIQHIENTAEDEDIQNLMDFVGKDGYVMQEGEKDIIMDNINTQKARSKLKKSDFIFLENNKTLEIMTYENCKVWLRNEFEKYYDMITPETTSQTIKKYVYAYKNINFLGGNNVFIGDLKTLRNEYREQLDAVYKQRRQEEREG